MTVRRVYELVRHRTLPNAGSRTLFFKSSGGGTKRHPGFFLRPDQVPDFDGERAWFVCERSVGGYWRAIERVDERGRPYEEPADAALRS